MKIIKIPYNLIILQDKIMIYIAQIDHLVSLILI